MATEKDVSSAGEQTVVTSELAVMIDQEIQNFLVLVHRHGYNVSDLKQMDPEVFEKLARFWPLKLNSWLSKVGRCFAILVLILCIFSIIYCIILMLSLFRWVSPETIFTINSHLVLGYAFVTRTHDIHEEMCLVYHFHIEWDPFRLPQDCGICRNLQSVPTVVNISREEFTEKYAYSRIPLLVTGATKHWTAHQYFSFSMLQTIYTRKRSSAKKEYFVKNNDSLSTESNYAYAQSDEEKREDKWTCQFFPYSSGFQSLKQVFKMTVEEAMNASEQPWYVGWSNCDSDVAEILRSHYSKPHFLPKYSESSRLDWLFMGLPGHGAPIHIDNMDNIPSWQAQIRGTKEWTLKAPYECRYECPHTLKLTVRPGDIFIFDSNVWFHGTKIIGEEMSLTIGSEYD